MGLIICAACGRQRNVKPIKRGVLRCSNCGASGPQILHRLKVWHDRADKEGVGASEARSRVLAGLKWIANQRGYKPAWVGIQYKRMFEFNGRQGRFPAPLVDNGVKSEPPGAGLVAWIDRRNAQYKRAKREQEKAYNAPH